MIYIYCSQPLWHPSHHLVPSAHGELHALCTIYSQHVRMHHEAGGYGGRSKTHQSAWWSRKGLIIRDLTQEK